MNFKLIDVVSAATATVALVIGSSIFLQILATKSINIFERFRALTGEYRGEHPSVPRRHSLEQQIMLYYTRAKHIQHATHALTVAVLCFLLTIVMASCSVIFPQSASLKIVGAAALILGLLSMSLGVAFEIMESQVAKRELDSELRDLPNLSPQKFM